MICIECVERDMLNWEKKIFDKGFQSGQKQKEDEVLKLIDNWTEESIGDDEVNEAQAIISYREVQELKSKLSQKDYETRETKRNFVSEGDKGK
jgi:hypothetical protein